MARSDIEALIVLKERTRPPEALEKRGEQLCQKREFGFYWVVLVGQESSKEKGTVAGKRDCGGKQNCIRGGGGLAVRTAGGYSQAVLLG